MGFLTLVLALIDGLMFGGGYDSEDDHGVSMMIGFGVIQWHLILLVFALVKAAKNFRDAPKEERQRVVLWLGASIAALPSYFAYLRH